MARNIVPNEMTPLLQQIEERSAQQFRKIQRPCYYFLRVLGIWQPENCHFLWKFYTKFLVWVLWLAFITVLLLQVNFVFKPETFLNLLCTTADFCCPLLFLRYYLKFGNYNSLVLHIYEISDESSLKTMKKARYVYTSISAFMWLIMASYFCYSFIYHWESYWDGKWWFYFSNIVMIIYTTGWWSVWFTLYGFVCQAHNNEILMYQKHMIDVFNSGTNEDYVTSENLKSGHLLFRFNELETMLQRTQCDFSKIISIAVGYHVADLFITGWTISKGHYEIWQYCGTGFYDLVSILIKLYPAAIVSQSLHESVVLAGNICTLGPNKSIPYSRLNFFGHLSCRVHGMGLCILGVKITLSITVGIFVTVGSTLIAFLRLVFAG